MGPGFDCIGMALSIYNRIEIAEGTDNGADIVIHAASGIPKDEKNLIYKTVRDFYKQAGKPLPPLTLWQQDDIPMARGLGSSAACVVAGLLAGNALAKTGLSREELTRMAAHIEGHPDNVAPAIAGGLVIGAMGDGFEYIRLAPEWPGLRFALMVPDFTLHTEIARNALPKFYSRRDAVYNASRTALLVAALCTGDYDKLTTALDDRIHQPYRKPLVPGMDAIFVEARIQGAYNTFLSGAGPALIAAVPESKDDFLHKMEVFLRGLAQKWSIQWVEPDVAGAVAEEIE
jgi:homoserine kinase